MTCETVNISSTIEQTNLYLSAYQDSFNTNVNTNVDNLSIAVSANIQPIDLTLSPITNFVNLSVFETGGLNSRWGLISGSLSAQRDLWDQLTHISLSSLDNNGYKVSLGADGVIILPATNDDTSNQILGRLSDQYWVAPSGGQVNLASNNGSNYIWVDDYGAYVATNWNNTYTAWVFDLSGKLISPSQNSILYSSGDALFQSITATDTIQASHILSGGVDLTNVFASSIERQTLSFEPSSSKLSISLSNNNVNLSSLGYTNYNAPVSIVIGSDSYFIQTIRDFTTYYSYLSSNFGTLYTGYTVTLFNGRVYTFAGTDVLNYNHYLEVNDNPFKPIYVEVPITSGTSAIIDSFYVGGTNGFKTAKYNIQIETNTDTHLYYSELSVLGTTDRGGTVCEYSQIATTDLINGYDVNISFDGYLQLIVNYTTDSTPGKRLILKGQRTNFYKI